MPLSSQVTASFLEIYGEDIFDLLDETGADDGTVGACSCSRPPSGLDCRAAGLYSWNHHDLLCRFLAAPQVTGRRVPLPVREDSQGVVVAGLKQVGQHVPLSGGRYHTSS